MTTARDTKIMIALDRDTRECSQARTIGKEAAIAIKKVWAANPAVARGWAQVRRIERQANVELHKLFNEDMCSSCDTWQARNERLQNEYSIGYKSGSGESA